MIAANFYQLAYKFIELTPPQPLVSLNRESSQLVHDSF